MAHPRDSALASVPHTARPSAQACALPSFWLGGYEGADHVNAAGEPLDMVSASGHAARLDHDYRAARRLGLRCVRESIGWRLTERPDGTMDLARAVRMAEAASRQGIQILWTLMHYGLPADLTLFDDALIPRFARFAAEVARVLKPLCPGPRIYTPINEISYLCWAASATDDMGPAGRRARGAVPDERDHGYLIKQRLVRAALAGMDAIRGVDPQARFLHIEPVVHVVPREDTPADRALAERISSYQWQALDMLAGRMDPQLGGHPEALDLIGVNHYHSSQWEVPGDQRLHWHLRDPRRRPLSALLQDVWQRYGRPVMVAETGHVGVGRAAWLNEVAGEALQARRLGVPLMGVCLYPLLDRPDWNDTIQWHRSGLWHLPHPQARRLNLPFARALSAWQGASSASTSPRPVEAAGLLVLLPCAWEAWQAPKAMLLASLAGLGHVHFLEPPRGGPSEPSLHHHSLAPAADLLVLHGGGEATWTQAPTAAQLALLRALLPRGGRERWACWLAGWRDDAHPAWWRELGRAGLILQADSARPPRGDVIVRANAMLAPHWPASERLRPPRHSYEDQEAGHLLRDIPLPRVWLKAPGPSAHAVASRVQRLAATWPQRQLVIDAAAPAGADAGAPNVHWLGAIHDDLYPALAAHLSGVVPWEGPTGWGTLDNPPVAAAAPRECPAVSAMLAALVAAVERFHARANTASTAPPRPAATASPGPVRRAA